MNAHQGLLDFATALQEARRRRGWSQGELARRSGVSVPTINRYENGKTDAPQPAQCRRLFRELGLDMRTIPVLLGYITEEELKLPAGPVLSPQMAEAVRLVAEAEAPEAVVAEWVAFLQFRLQSSAAGQG